MDNKTVNKHIKALGKLFPKTFLKHADEFYGTTGGVNGLWTGFGEDGGYDYWTHYTHPKLQKYLDKHELHIEPHDAGTVMIFSSKS